MAWGQTAKAAYNKAQNVSAYDPSGAGAAKLLGQGQQYLDPTGRALSAMRRRQAIRNAMNRRQRGLMSARVAGVDPSQARYLLAEGDAASAGDTADYLNQSQFDEQQGMRDWFRNLYMDRLGRSDQLDDREYQRKLMQQQQRGALMGGLGRLAGLGLAAIPGGAYADRLRGML